MNVEQHPAVDRPRELRGPAQRFIMRTFYEQEDSWSSQEVTRRQSELTECCLVSNVELADQGGTIRSTAPFDFDDARFPSIEQCRGVSGGNNYSAGIPCSVDQGASGVRLGGARFLVRPRL